MGGTLRESVILGGESRGDDGAAVREAAEVFQLLLKGIKNIGIYRHAETRYIEYLEPAHRALTRFLERHESLPLKLKPYALEYDGETIYEDEDRENLTYKFYKDGVRYLIFRAGIPREELLAFVLLSIESLKDSQLFQEDMVTRLWKQDLAYIEHIVVEGFGFGDLSEDEVQIEVDKVIGLLRKQLAANSDDIARFARLSLEDLDLQMSDVEQVRGGIISGRPARPADKGRLQDALLAEQKELVFRKMVLILFQMLEYDFEPEDYDMMSEATGQVLDSLILSEDIRGAVALVERFDRILKRDLPAHRKVMIERLRDGTKHKMLETQRLEAVANYLTLARDIDDEAVRTYLSECREEHVPLMLELLSKAERTDARRVLVDVLSKLAKSQLPLLGQKIESGSTATVRDVLAIIERIDPPNKLALIAKTFRHDNIGVRLEGLKQLAKSSEPEALRYIERAAADPDIQIRLGAYRALVQRSPRRASEFFVQAARADGFSAKDQREKTAVYVALGHTRTEAALKFLGSIFETKSNLLQRSRVNEQKLLSLAGLQAFGTFEAFQILKREIQNRNNSKEIMQAARKAALQLREKLERSRGQPEAAPAGEDSGLPS